MIFVAIVSQRAPWRQSARPLGGATRERESRCAQSKLIVGGQSMQNGAEISVSADVRFRRAKKEDTKIASWCGNLAQTDAGETLKGTQSTIKRPNPIASGA